MDYDENDFRSQSFQLVGEDNKLSSNLRSFALPKFDLDEHLRFDNLVEPEVLLGIQGQVNNWIDFPSGSSAIEFGSSAVESCSLSRHNNIWYEAMSSESVDLLLKSVGEEEMISNKAINMDDSAKERFHDIDNHVDLQAEGDNTCNSSGMDVLPSNAELIQNKSKESFSGLHEGQMELQGSSQLEVESRTFLCVGPTNGELNSGGKIDGDHYMAEDNDPDEHSASVYECVSENKDLCDAFFKERHTLGAFMRTNAPNTDVSYSSVVASHSPDSITCSYNEGVKLVFASEKLSTGFLNEQHHGNISNLHGLLHDNVQKESSLLVHSDENANDHSVPKSDALEMVKKKSSDSVISENSDGLFVATSCQDGNSSTGDEIPGNDGFEKNFMKEQNANFENSSTNSIGTTIPKLSRSTEGCGIVGGRLPNDPMEDDELHGRRNQLIKSSNIVSGDTGQKVDACVNNIEKEQDRIGKLDENNNSDVENATDLSKVSKAVFNASYVTQGMGYKDYGQINTDPLSFTTEKAGDGIEGNHTVDMDAEVQSLLLAVDKDTIPNVSSLAAVSSDAKSETKVSEHCKSYKADKAVVDLSKVHVSLVDVSANSDASMLCTSPVKINSGSMYKLMEKNSNLSPADLQTDECLSLDVSSIEKLVDEKLDSVLVQQRVQKSLQHHCLPQENNAEAIVVVEKREPIVQVGSSSDSIHSSNFVKDSAFLAPYLTSDLSCKRARDLASICYPFNMSHNSPPKISENDSGSNFASPIKSSKCQISVGTIGVEMNLFGASSLSNSRENVTVEMFNGADSGAGCLKEPLIDNSTERHSNAVMQPSSPVQSTDCTLHNEVPASEGDALGDVKPLTHEKDSISHKLAGESFDGCHSMEAIPHVMNEVSVVSAQTMEPVPVGRQVEHASSPAEGSCSGEEPSNEQIVECNFGTRDVSNGHNLSEKTDGNSFDCHLNGSSQICTGNTMGSNPSEAQIPSEAQSTNPFSCVHHFCGSTEVINYSGHAQVVSGHQEPKVMLDNNLGSSGRDDVALNVECSNNDLQQSVSSPKDRSLPLEVSTLGDLPESVADSEYKSCSELHPIDISQIPKENPQGFPEVEVDNFLTKTNKADHPKDASRPSYGKKMGSRSKIKKEMHALKQSSEIEVKYSGGTSKSVGTPRKDMQLVEIHETSSSEFNSIKASSFLAVQTSSIPDLNSSSLTSFHQPFTDLQQVQLRAQIFVYGALISGIPPDEACMLSAFGNADGGRSLWESVWRVCITKFQNQKSPNSGYETPLHARSGAHVQSNIYNTSAAESPGKTLSSVMLSSTVPIPSHMWNLSSVDDKHVASMSRGTYLNFSQTPSPLPTCQSLQSRQNVGTNSSWFSQYPHLGPWFVTSQSSAPDGIAKYSMTPVAEAVHVTPVRETLGPHTPTPTIQVVPPSALMSAPDAKATTVVTALQTQTNRRVEMSGNNRCNQTSQKSRKRKKDVAADELIIQVSQTSGESVSAVGVVKSSSLPSTATLMPSNSTARVGSCTPVSISMSEIFLPTHYNIVGDSGGQKKVIFSEETCSKIELAKLHAEDAAALADSTVKYSQAVWNQLAAQKNSELASEVELKLASAAVAVAASASVAKAAAAAAKVAYDAALQAKLMADEAASAAKSGNTVQCLEHDIVDFGKILNESSVYAGKEVDKNPESGKVISAAREVARRRVESASAATKRAENLDSIVKAAELAAAAVVQAGTIIAMGDPLPFKVSELVDTGSEGFWKAYHGASIKQSRPSILLGEEHITLGSAREFAGFGKQLDRQIPEDKDTQKATEDGRSSSLNENHEQYEGLTQGNCPNAGHGSGHCISCLSIQKGSKVEVMSDDDGLKGAWFSAMVHDIKGNKAYVCFDDVSNNLGQLMEWIDLESDGQKAPRIRAVRSATSLKHEGTRKRSREQRGSYIWNVGDHVDAWIHDRWWEAIVDEKNLGDETMLTVHIPVRSDKKVVHSTYLRPSLIWKDGQWLEWSYPDRKPLHLHEGDTPQEKRQRLGRLESVSHLEVDSGEVGKLSNDICRDVSNKPEDARSLVLTDMDKTFCIGKSSREESTTGTVRTRSGLQKEGSRVVFGVPRPGKKRKFIEVSKHYVAGKSEKISEGKEPIKFAKYLMPQASRQFKSTSRVDRKGKKGTEVILKDAVTVENSQSFRSRTQPEKDSSLIGTSVRELRHVHPQNNAHGLSGNGNGVEKRNTPKFGSCADHAEQINVPLSETESCVEAEPSISISKKKNAPTSGTNVVAKTKSTVDRPSKDEDKSSENPGKVACTVIKQPRRSNRRIQPTSRLLEGLQSSLLVSKIPSIAHERKPHRGGSFSRGNAHG